ncbi:MAG: DUF2332 domain-containing protein [Rubricella sp.]
MTYPEQIADHFAEQATHCDAMGSPYTARLCRLLPDALTGEMRTRVAAWPGIAKTDALALRICGGLKSSAALGGPMAAVQPPEEATDAEIAAAIRDTQRWRPDFLPAWLASAPQTNEVGRSAMLLGGLLELDRRFALPITLLEIGASAGVNLFPDRNAYDLGNDRTWAAEGATVRIRSDWRGSRPDLARIPRVISRRGSDLAPIDAGDPAVRARMLAYVWADQEERLARAEAALEQVAASGIAIEQGSAAAWLETVLNEPQEAGTLRVVQHTVMWQYMPEREKAAGEAAFAAAGARATPDRPLARLSVEYDGDYGGAAITLTTWPGGKPELIGRSQFHGAWVEWMLS